MAHGNRGPVRGAVLAAVASILSACSTGSGYFDLPVSCPHPLVEYCTQPQVGSHIPRRADCRCVTRADVCERLGGWQC